jgi:RNA polymerase sigma factor (sigma-70 family)
VFPTTRWTAIRQAAEQDPQALESFAERYRAPVLRFLRIKGFDEADAEDLCQDAFLRVLKGGVLRRADPDRGRFGSLLRTVVVRTMQDHLRRRRPEVALGDGSADVPDGRDPDLDRLWVLHLAERAMGRLRERGSPYAEVLAGHLAGDPQDRKRLHHARRKLIAAIREEVALTCASHDEFETEVAYLSGFLRPPRTPRDSVEHPAAPREEGNEREAQ